VPTTTQPPPPPSRGNLKYVVLGLACLAIAIGLWLAASSSKPPPAPPPPKPAEVARVNPMDQQLELEEEKVPDAGTAPAAPEEVVKKPTAPATKRDEWECSGDLPGAGAVVRANSVQVRSCYERRLKMNNLLQGDVRLKLKVGAGGKVVATALSGSMHDADVLACMRNLAQSWTFPVPSGGSCAVVQVPFQFSPKQ
jgi:hypothetical protein